MIILSQDPKDPPPDPKDEEAFSDWVARQIAAGRDCKIPDWA